MSNPAAPSPLCSLQTPSTRHIDTHARAALLDRFALLQSQCIDPDTFDGADFELWQALDAHARESKAVLDLRPHGQALARVPAELMEAFFDVRRCQAPALQVMYLPSELRVSTDWLGACPDGVLIVQEAELTA